MVRDESRQVDRQARARYIDVLVTGAVTECISAVQCKRWQPQGISQERKLTHTEITQMGSQRESENKSGCLARLGEGQRCLLGEQPSEQESQHFSKVFQLYLQKKGEIQLFSALLVCKLAFIINKW